MRQSLLTLASLFLLLQSPSFAGTLSFTLSPDSSLTGSPGSTVGWGFTISNTFAPGSPEWILIDQVQFNTPTPVGVFAPFGFPMVIGPGVGNLNPYAEAFDNALATGVGRVTIDAGAQAGDFSAGDIVLLYSIYSADPVNDPLFDPGANLVAAGLSASASALVTVSGASQSVPEPSAALLLLAAGSGLALLARRKSHHPTLPAAALTIASLTAGAAGVSAQEISTVAGNPPPLVNGPVDGQFLDSTFGRLATDASGNLIASFFDADQVVRISPSSGTLTVLAGVGQTRTSGGDGGPATSALVNAPYHATTGPGGSLYIAEFFANRVRRVDPAGIISTVAGSNSGGFSGDGGPAINARLLGPDSVAVDSAGNLYIAETHRIRKVNAAGVISTIAGTGAAGFNGDGLAAASAQLNFPRGLIVDASGNLFFADAGNDRVRRISAAGFISTIAGTGVAGFSGDGGPAATAQLNNPFAVALDAAGNLYIADRGNHRVRRVTPAGVIATVAGTGVGGYSGDGGSATSARILEPVGVAIDTAGDLFICASSRIRRVTPAGIISTIAGRARFGPDNAPALNSLLDRPLGLAMDAAGAIYIADQFNHRVRKVSPAGIISTFAGNGQAASTGDGGQAGSAALNAPSGVFVDPAGNLFISEVAGHRIRKVTPAGVISTFAGTGVAGSTGDGGPAASARLSGPRQFAMDSEGNLYISEQTGHRVRRITPAGIISTVAGTGVGGFNGDGPAASAQLNAPAGLAITPSGRLFIADWLNHRIRVLAGGVLSTFAGTGLAGFGGDGGPAANAQLNSPYGVALDAAENLWIADEFNHRIRFVSGLHGITTVAGSGASGFGGGAAGEVALNARLNGPISVLLPGDGRLLFADHFNHRIRQIANPTPIAVSFSRQNTGGRSVTIDGIAYDTPVIRLWTPGSSHTVSVPAIVSTGQEERYVFSGWSDGVSSASRVIVADPALTSFTAGFTRQFLVTTSANPAAGGTVTAGGWFDEGSRPSFSAAANPGYVFNGFFSNGIRVSQTSPVSLVLNGPPPAALIAQFAAGLPTLSLVRTASTGLPANRVWTLTLSNTGPVTAQSVILGPPVFTQTGGSPCALPSAYPNGGYLSAVEPGLIAAGSPVVVQRAFDFGNCAPNARFSVTFPLTALGGYRREVTLLNQFR